MGMYHCGYCGEMVLAGVEHVDYSEPDEPGQIDPENVERG